MVCADTAMWHLAKSLQQKPADDAEPLALIVLNTPIPSEYRKMFLHLWQNASLRVCADGGANRVLDFFGQDVWSSMKLPQVITGDLDSAREDTCAFFSQRVCILDN